MPQPWGAKVRIFFALFTVCSLGDWFCCWKVFSICLVWHSMTRTTYTLRIPLLNGPWIQQFPSMLAALCWKKLQSSIAPRFPNDCTLTITQPPETSLICAQDSHPQWPGCYSSLSLNVPTKKTTKGHSAHLRPVFQESVKTYRHCPGNLVRIQSFPTWSSWGEHQVALEGKLDYSTKW